MTEGLQAIFDFANLYRPIAPRLHQALRDCGTRCVVDLCSGAGGPWPKLRETCAQEFADIQICLTDKYPNAKALARFNDGRASGIRFKRESVDILDMPHELSGFRTMFTSFHHFRPDEAHAILKSAVEKQQGIGVFEIPKRGVRAIPSVFLVPLVYWSLVPSMRPFNWSRLVWAYLLPVIPFVLWFDGIVSCFRAYRASELKEMTRGLSANGYRWEIGEQAGGGIMPATVTYLIGCPSPKQPDAAQEHAAAECSS